MDDQNPGNAGNAGGTNIYDVSTQTLIDVIINALGILSGT